MTVPPYSRMDVTFVFICFPYTGLLVSQCSEGLGSRLLLPSITIFESLHKCFEEQLFWSMGGKYLVPGVSVLSSNNMRKITAVIPSALY